MNETSPPISSELGALLLDARERTLALTGDLDGEKLLGPKLDIVNPPLWELGHQAWFQERWCLRYRNDGSLAPSMIPNADQLYDSATVAHDTRWDLPLLDYRATLSYLDAVLQRVMERLAREGGGSGLDYFAQLAVFHEDMHGEAFAYTRQTLGYSRPKFGTQSATPSRSGPWPGDVFIEGGEFMLGAPPDSGFVFDNEKWQHPVTVKPFRIARAPVTNAEFAEFIADRGYQREELWSKAGWNWRREAKAGSPVYWIKQDNGWLLRVFDEMAALPPHAPVMHINWFEAEAYCRWAGRRLPTEAEWEMAAAHSLGAPDGEKRRYPWGDKLPLESHAQLDGVNTQCADVSAYPEGDSATGCRQMLGNVWEWTAERFMPYPGFIIDPYQEYSQPWFGDHMVLRGGCFATRARLIRNTWRNFYTPDRRDVFAGFRTCAAA